MYFLGRKRNELKILGVILTHCILETVGARCIIISKYRLLGNVENILGEGDKGCTVLTMFTPFSLRTAEEKGGEKPEEVDVAEEVKESNQEVQEEEKKKQDKETEDEGKPSVDLEEKRDDEEAGGRTGGEDEYGGGGGGEEGEEEEEEEDVFGALSVFTSEVLGTLGCPADPMSPQDRSPRPLPHHPTDIPSIMKLLQVVCGCLCQNMIH